MGKSRKKFNDQPFPYHAEIELEITTLTNLGSGLGRVPLQKSSPEVGDSGGWVVMVPFTLPGERVRARVFRNHRNFSEADLVAVLTPSSHRVTPRCPLFGHCGGCQYQHLAYPAQLAWKRRQVTELLQHMAGVVDFPVAPVVSSPREYHYRSKITPHFNPPRTNGVRSAERETQPDESEELNGGADADTAPDTGIAPANNEGRVNVTPMPIGFLRQGTRFDIVDVPHCPIATEAINVRLGAVREAVRARQADYKRGATLLLREASGSVTTDYDAVITETIPTLSSDALAAALGGPPAANLPPSTPRASSSPPASLQLHFLARDFFQNNPFILPAFTGYVREQAAASGARFLVDAYCGSGLFALTAASAFERVVGIEISESSVRFARENAAANEIRNATFVAGDAGAIFAALDPSFVARDTVVIIDPPRKGCDDSFLEQLFTFNPRAVVYVSCDPATQMRDLRRFLGAGYVLVAARPFDLFPQTRHLECVLTLQKPA